MRTLWLIALAGLSVVFLWSRKDGSARVDGRVLETGVASWYGPGFDGRQTASGEIFRQNEMTAAHKKMKFGTFVRVVNLNNGKSVVVKVNDRGPFIPGRIIDLSRGAAEVLDFIDKGVTDVEIRTS